MKILAVLFIPLALHAADLDAARLDRLADAIWRAEGGERARWPYGMTGYKNATTARRDCKELIQREWRAYEFAWKKGVEKRSFIEALGDVYCPPHVHPLNRNWVRNVVKIYAQHKS